MTLLAFGYSGYNAVTDSAVHPAYPCLMPLMLLVTLTLTLRRTVIIHRSLTPGLPQSPSPWRRVGEAVSALVRPRPAARALRNAALALSLGLVQGAASALSAAGQLPLPYDLFIISLTLLFLSQPTGGTMKPFSVWTKPTSRCISAGRPCPPS